MVNGARKSKNRGLEERALVYLYSLKRIDHAFNAIKIG